LGNILKGKRDIVHQQILRTTVMLTSWSLSIEYCNLQVWFPLEPGVV